jgi:hypothetical protein
MAVNTFWKEGGLGKRRRRRVPHENVIRTVHDRVDLLGVKVIIGMIRQRETGSTMIHKQKREAKKRTKPSQRRVRR